MFNRKRPKTLASRLTLWFALAFIMFLLASAMVAWFAMSVILADRMDEDLEEDIEEFQILYQTSGKDAVISEIDREVQSGDHEVTFLQLLGADGTVIYSSELEYWQGLKLNPKMLEQAVRDSAPVMGDLDLDSQEEKTRTILGFLDSDLLLYIGESVEENQEILELLLIILAAMLLLVIPLASTVVWFISRKSVEGITEVSRAALDIEQGHLDRRARVSSRDDEVRRLADTFNKMAERIRELVSEMREMIDNIAHDLRSPLARIRAISESALSSKDPLGEEGYKHAITDTLEECDRMINLINSTLDVAEAEANITSLDRGRVDFTQLVHDACELFEPLAEQKSIVYSYNVKDGCFTCGNRQNLQRMVTNLVDNAIKYTQPHGEVRVELVNSDNQIVLKVNDTGIGISDAEQKRVFQRFYRSDSSRGEQGCGLGLSFARAVVRAHEGEIKLSSRPGVGSEFTVTIEKVASSEQPEIQCTTHRQVKNTCSRV